MCREGGKEGSRGNKSNYAAVLPCVCGEPK